MSTTDTDEAFLVGHVNPVGVHPSFTIPIFVEHLRGNTYLTQKLSPDGLVNGFETINISSLSITFSPLQKLSIADEALFSFAVDEAVFFIGTRASLIPFLEDNKAAWSDKPFLALQVIEFYKSDDHRLHLARQSAYRSLRSRSPFSANFWRDAVVLLPKIRETIRRLAGNTWSDKFERHLSNVDLSVSGQTAIVILPNELIKLIGNIDTHWQEALRNSIISIAKSFDIKKYRVRKVGARPAPESSRRLKLGRHISPFISHSAEDNEEARHYEALLQEAGFSVFGSARALRPGDSVMDTVSKEVNRCHFFLFLVSDYSLASAWMQRELGLALSLQQQTRGYRPIIIPIYAKNAAGRRSGRRPDSFPTRDFKTGDEREPFDLSSRRGLDRHASPMIDSDDALISLMTPQLLVSRVDFDDEGTFERTDVFRLYEDIFPPVERDSRDDIVNWVLQSDLGTERSVRLVDGTKFSFSLDSRYFILSLMQEAIGLAFFTYDSTSKLVYGNYFAVQEFWRGGDIATAFLEEVLRVQRDLFPEHQGIVFEVERFDRGEVERIVSHLETHGTFEAESDQNEMRRFLRIQWFQRIGCLFFVDQSSKEPLVCTAPCIDPSEHSERWSGLEENYWIMWLQRSHTPLDMSNAKTLWESSVNCIYREVLIKSLIDAYPENGLEYWRYANAVVDRTLERTQSSEVAFGKLRSGSYASLFRRWVKLGIDLPF